MSHVNKKAAAVIFGWPYGKELDLVSKTKRYDKGFKFQTEYSNYQSINSQGSSTLHQKKSSNECQINASFAIYL